MRNQIQAHAGGGGHEFPTPFVLRDRAGLRAQNIWRGGPLISATNSNKSNAPPWNSRMHEAGGHQKSRIFARAPVASTADIPAKFGKLFLFELNGDLATESVERAEKLPRNSGWGG
jgi:hypothetical protein